jgi:hypothetical protein
MRLRLAYKKGPALTLAQARQLIARAIEQDSDHFLDVSAAIRLATARSGSARSSGTGKSTKSPKFPDHHEHQAPRELRKDN